MLYCTPFVKQDLSWNATLQGNFGDLPLNLAFYQLNYTSFLMGSSIEPPTTSNTLILFSSTAILNKTPSKPTAALELAGGKIPIPFGKNLSTSFWEPLRAILLSDSWRLLLVLKGGYGNG